MDFLELAKKRYSVRMFRKASVEQEKIEKILEAGRVSPTAVNKQPQRILVLKEQEELEKLKNCTKFTFDAPLVFVICYDKTVSWKRRLDGKESGEIDASIVATHMMLEACQLEIGTTWVGSFDPKCVRESYAIPENYEIVCLLVAGYEEEGTKPNPMHEERFPMDYTVKYHHF